MMSGPSVPILTQKQKFKEVKMQKSFTEYLKEASLSNNDIEEFFKS
jgi:hypothetical protein